MSNTLTNLIPEIEDACDVVCRELVGFIPAVTRNSSAERAALNEVIRYPITPAATTGDVTPGATPPNDGDQAIASDTLAITKSKYSPVRWNGEEMRGVSNSGQRMNVILRDQFAQSMRALCNLIEVDLWTAAYQNASRAYGTAGTAPFGTAGDLTDSANVLRILEDNGMGQGGDLHLVVGAGAMANLRGKQSVLFKVNEAGTDELLRRGTIGLLQGLQLHNSNAVQQLTKGTGASYVTSGSTAVGVTDIALVTGTGTVLAGDVVTFAADGVNKYVVKTGVAAPGTISLGKPGARVTIATANALTVGNSYTPNIALARSALHLVTRAPALPIINGQPMDMADDRYTVTDPLSGLSFEVSMYRQYKQVKFEVAVAWGTKAAKQDGIATLIG
jgi:hypothetical protein